MACETCWTRGSGAGSDAGRGAPPRRAPAGPPRPAHVPHSRPHVSNDNPFSEAHFKTLKYRPAFPERFGSIQDARAHCHVFSPWYNTEHRHTGLGLLTPHDVHHGQADQRIAARSAVLATAYAAHPERFLRGLPQPPARPMEVWINPPNTLVPFQESLNTEAFSLARGGALA
jgi:hypothetical protein